MRIITVSGTESKRALAEYIADGVPGAWLLAFEGVEGEEAAEGGEYREGFSGAELEAAVSGCPDVIPDGSVVVLEANVVFSGLEPALAVLFTDVPLEKLEPGAWAAGGNVDLALLQWGPAFEKESGLGVERMVKSASGAHKVLIYEDEEGRRRAFQKTLDIVRSRLGGTDMPEEMPDKVIEAVKAEAVDDRMSCERAQELAGELGVPIPVVGRALDLLEIKIIKCQLGCF